MSQTTAAMIPATRAQTPAVANVLAAAFQDDPLFAWGIPDPERRREALPTVFAAFAELYLPYEETYLTEDALAAAMWGPPHVDAFHGEAGEAFGQRMAGNLDPADTARLLAVGQLFSEHHPTQPWMYLQLIGVAPDHQGRGLGSGLLAPVLARCDATGTPAYLEASSVRNRRLYERHGFETVGELTLPDDGPPIWPMWREPAGA